MASELTTKTVNLHNLSRPTTNGDFEVRLSRLDTGLFEHILSQTTEEDKRSLLALQSALRKMKMFVYLEIGSYLGGSLQPYLIDPRCRQVISIDSRPILEPDERGHRPGYRASAEDMQRHLRTIKGADLSKLYSIDAGTDALTRGQLPAIPDLCFIDGEHTDVAALRDARFCLSAMTNGGIIVFHDANIVYNAIQAVINELNRSSTPFRAFHLSDSIFVIEVGGLRISDREPVRSLQLENYKGYLWSLMETNSFRRFFNRPIFKLYRQVRLRTDRIAIQVRNLMRWVNGSKQTGEAKRVLR